jgi:integrase
MARTFEIHLAGAPETGERGHHAAMPYKSVPEFVASLPEREAITSSALEFLILTASPSGEVLDVHWDEIDLESHIWTMPTARMKAGKEHRVPLSERAVRYTVCALRRPYFRLCLSRPEGETPTL